MSQVRTFLLLAALALLTSGAAAQPAAGATEASLRSAMTQYVAAWNAKDVAAWSALLAEDVWYFEAPDYYQRSKGKANVLAFHADTVKLSDLAWDIKRIKLRPDNTATVVLAHTANILPKAGGKYASSFVSDPSVARWRLEGGVWKLYYFTTHKGSALDAMGKDGVN